MIEEVDSAQYIQHYFEKVYTELDRSPEMFIRAALEFVDKSDGLLRQPGALESLARLAGEIADRQGGDSPASSPETAPPPLAAQQQREAAMTDSATDAAAANTPAAPVPSAEMADAPADTVEAEEGEEGDSGPAASTAWRKFPSFSLLPSKMNSPFATQQTAEI